MRSRKKHRGRTAALVSAAGVLGTLGLCLVFWSDVEVVYHRLRLEVDGDYLLRVLESPGDTPQAVALERYSRSPRGMDRLVSVYLSKMSEHPSFAAGLGGLERQPARVMLIVFWRLDEAEPFLARREGRILYERPLGLFPADQQTRAVERLLLETGPRNHPVFSRPGLLFSVLDTEGCRETFGLNSDYPLGVIHREELRGRRDGEAALRSE